MYRVNAERSQEKNDRNARMQRCTKVTCATHARRKSSRGIATHSHLFSYHAVSAARTVSGNACLRLRLDCAPRICAELSAIYNERRFYSAQCFRQRVQGAQLWPVRMML